MNSRAISRYEPLHRSTVIILNQWESNQTTPDASTDRSCNTPPPENLIGRRVIFSQPHLSFFQLYD